MIILYGSYAKGTYKEHRYVSKDVKYEYVSDIDFLVITKSNQDNVSVQESKIMSFTEELEQPINLEIHEIDYVNKGLEWGEYFWTDIVKEGIILYDNGNIQLSEPRVLSPAERKEKAQTFYNTWFPQSSEFLIDANNAANRGNYRLADFYSHQASECLYYSTLLVFTDYKPKVHNLWKLRKKAKPFSQELFHLFRAETDREEEHLFELLKQGYIDARYRTDFSISETELWEIIKRVTIMISIVENICKAHIDGIN